MTKFITLEGIEGVGKSTALKFICDFLSKHGIPYVVTREPGGTELAEKIRRLLLDKHDEPMCVDAELLLVFAARAQHLERLIRPSLASGSWVICDRFTDSSYAYQGAGRSVDAAHIDKLVEFVHPNFAPDHTLLLDAPVDIALSRAQTRSEPDRIEQERAEFFERARACFLERAKQFPERYLLIDAGASIAQVTEALASAMSRIVAP